ncbi:NAD-dependent epimerase/dehydratase [Fadolivirus algeromassiliense]|jgi:UDP-N-acetylglucosamine 4-epimerase|uniref:NAD-dependent epimerase/dehydratase n=1 Tax=Fadolivirus FV1/VV64 TaxID=3070911 RepID=A0A7D3QVJ8_9VIRU|nr:NAD-dependent epimerase/dehydratase [Fadolivirus algeromassiliense]QKF94324.1 NAD-dependent epimerase/dehydratase [Fadolivirus FV1/VV64]
MNISELSFLVTGGAGFIGSHITQYLLEHNAKFVRVLDNLSTGKIDNIKHLLDKYSNFEFHHGDITNYETCLKSLSGINVICHQAAVGSVPKSIDFPLNSHNSNVNGFLNILEAARNCNIKRIVYASSSSVYGDDEHLPKVEEFTGNLLSPYAVTKYVDELYASVYTRLYKLECIGLRYFNVFGPRQDPNGPYAAVIPKFIDYILNNKAPTINGNGTYSRDFTFVENVVNANINAMLINNNECYGTAFNIGCGENTTILDLFNIIKNICNKDIKPLFGEIRAGDPPHSLANIDKARKLLNYDPKISIINGLNITVKYSL